MLKVKGISARYNVITVLKDVSFSVGPGQLVAIVGANSAGKTTVLKTVSGLLHPFNGQIKFSAKKVADGQLITFKKVK